jgi:hypothetical protein
VQSRFDALLRDDCISPAEYDTGEAWSRDYHAAAERSVRLVSSFDLRMDGSHCSADPTQRRLDAIRRQRELAVALGPMRIRILESVLIFDISWRGLAQQLQLGCSRTAKSEVVDAVRALHAFQSGTAVPPYHSTPATVGVTRSGARLMPLARPVSFILWLRA